MNILEKGYVRVVLGLAVLFITLFFRAKSNLSIDALGWFALIMGF